MRDWKYRYGWKSWLIYAGMAVFAVVLVGNIETTPPESLRNPVVVQSRIMSCDFRKLTRHSSEFFVGLNLEKKGVPYLRANPKNRERKLYEAWCDQQTKVLIVYKAKTRILGPVRFWIKDIQPVP
jgi:hypothetical protein